MVSQKRSRFLAACILLVALFLCQDQDGDGDADLNDLAITLDADEDGDVDFNDITSALDVDGDASIGPNDVWRAFDRDADGDVDGSDVHDVWKRLDRDGDGDVDGSDVQSTIIAACDHDLDGACSPKDVPKALSIWRVVAICLILCILGHAPFLTCLESRQDKFDGTVYVHIYDLAGAAFMAIRAKEQLSDGATLWVHRFVRSLNSGLQCFGTGAFHTEVEVYGHQWGFFGGIGWQLQDNPANLPQKFKYSMPYYGSLVIGKTTKTKEEVLTLMKKFVDQEEWKPATYDPLVHNCTHGSRAICKELSSEDVPLMTLPSYITSAAEVIHVFWKSVFNPLLFGFVPLEKSSLGIIKSPKEFLSRVKHFIWCYALIVWVFVLFRLKFRGMLSSALIFDAFVKRKDSDWLSEAAISFAIAYVVLGMLSSMSRTCWMVLALVTCLHAACVDCHSAHSTGESENKKKRKFSEIEGE